MRTYSELLAELNGADIKGVNGALYDFVGYPLEEEFQKFFEMGQIYLDRDDHPFNIKPARFYYSTNTTVNAVAYLSNPFYLVEINKGAVFQLHEHFTSRENGFAKNELAPYKLFSESRGVTGSYLLFQYAMIYYLYHEVGHLIQRNEGEPKYIEHFGGHVPGNTSRERHMREHDADWFAANQLAFHAIQFVNKGAKESPDIYTQELAMSVEMGIASVLMYFIREEEGIPELYLEERSHPHAAVRISYMMMYFLQAIMANTNVQLNQVNCLSGAMRIVQTLLKDGQNDPVTKFTGIIAANSPAIQDYINKIRANSDTYPHLARKKMKSVVNE